MRALDPITEQAARRFLSVIGERFPVLGAVIYGSRARGDFETVSDADVAILLGGPSGSTVSTMLEMIGAAYDVELESGIVVSPLPIWQDQWDNPERFSNPNLIHNIRRDGIPL
jgi:predicted nucleotidyltransferase